ncbi:MerR family transcriptional regulator [Bacillus cereus]|nr:MerR family transcriptional regulator [Bacillus cereus]
MSDTEKWFSVLEIEKQTSIPDATIRRYIRNHGHHLQIKKRGKSYLIAFDSLSTIKKIRELYDKGKQIEDVEETLRHMNIPVTITVTDDKKK